MEKQELETSLEMSCVACGDVGEIPSLDNSQDD